MIASTKTSTVPQAWVHLLRAYAALTRGMSANLLAAHGLTINDYEVLLALSRADDFRMRRVDLAERILLTPSGVTRLLQGLENDGLVCPVRCPGDGRVVYAKLTGPGRTRLREAGRTHVRDIDSLVTERFSQEELDVLAELLGRLSGAGDADGGECASGDLAE